MSVDNVALSPAPKATSAGKSRVAAARLEWSSGYDAVLAELCPVLFASLPRSDQRRTGAQYLRGLLGVPGRKSIRNLAAGLGPHANEQSLHHFINSSTWDWAPLRRGLGHYLLRSTAPHAWVVRPMVVPKAGQHSVGVDRRFIPSLGQVLNAQQAIGVWAASPRISAPASWRLHLPRTWLEDMPRRSKASIPDEVEAETLGDCAVEAVLELPRHLGLPALPVVLDAREANATAIARRLSAARLPVLIRINGELPLYPAKPLTPSRAGHPIPAERILSAAPHLRRPVAWTNRPDGSGIRTNLVGAVPVMHRSVRSSAAGQQDDWLLLGVGAAGREWPAEFWLTDLTNAYPAELLQLMRLVDRVDRDFAAVGARVGIPDFVGRSFGGWHRHITLASAAHATAMIAQLASGRPRSISLL